MMMMPGLDPPSPPMVVRRAGNRIELTHEACLALLGERHPRNPPNFGNPHLPAPKEHEHAIPIWSPPIRPKTTSNDRSPPAPIKLQSIEANSARLVTSLVKSVRCHCCTKHPKTRHYKGLSVCDLCHSSLTATDHRDLNKPAANKNHASLPISDPAVGKIAKGNPAVGNIPTGGDPAFGKISEGDPSFGKIATGWATNAVSPPRVAAMPGVAAPPGVLRKKAGGHDPHAAFSTGAGSVKELEVSDQGKDSDSDDGASAKKRRGRKARLQRKVVPPPIETGISKSAGKAMMASVGNERAPPGMHGNGGKSMVVTTKSGGKTVITVRNQAGLSAGVSAGLSAPPGALTKSGRLAKQMMVSSPATAAATAATFAAGTGAKLTGGTVNISWVNLVKDPGGATSTSGELNISWNAHNQKIVMTDGQGKPIPIPIPPPPTPTPLPPPPPPLPVSVAEKRQTVSEKTDEKTDALLMPVMPVRDEKGFPEGVAEEVVLKTPERVDIGRWVAGWRAHEDNVDGAFDWLCRIMQLIDHGDAFPMRNSALLSPGPNPFVLPVGSFVQRLRALCLMPITKRSSHYKRLAGAKREFCADCPMSDCYDHNANLEPRDRKTPSWLIQKTGSPGAILPKDAAILAKAGLQGAILAKVGLQGVILPKVGSPGAILPKYVDRYTLDRADAAVCAYSNCCNDCPKCGTSGESVGKVVVCLACGVASYCSDWCRQSDEAQHRSTSGKKTSACAQARWSLEQFCSSVRMQSLKLGLPHLHRDSKTAICTAAKRRFVFYGVNPTLYLERYQQKRMTASQEQNILTEPIPIHTTTTTPSSFEAKHELTAFSGAEIMLFSQLKSPDDEIHLDDLLTFLSVECFLESNFPDDPYTLVYRRVLPKRTPSQNQNQNQKDEDADADEKGAKEGELVATAPMFGSRLTDDEVVSHSTLRLFAGVRGVACVACRAVVPSRQHLWLCHNCGLATACRRCAPNIHTHQHCYWVSHHLDLAFSHQLQYFSQFSP